MHAAGARLQVPTGWVSVQRISHINLPLRLCEVVFFSLLTQTDGWKSNLAA